jgi:hypothetical protein
MVARDYELAYETILRLRAALPCRFRRHSLANSVRGLSYVTHRGGRCDSAATHKDGQKSVTPAGVRSFEDATTTLERSARWPVMRRLQSLARSWCTIGRMDLVKGLAPGTLSRWVGD